MLALDPLNGVEKARFQWEDTPRMPPEVYKESGETRLYAYEGRILLVLPSCPWTLLLYEWQDIDGFKLQHSIPLEWVETSVIGNYHSVEITKKKITIHIFAKKKKKS